MKTVRILGFVVIVIIVLFASTSGFRGFQDGWDSVPETLADVNAVSLTLIPIKTCSPTVFIMLNYREMYRIDLKVSRLL